eukprot:2286170-Pyramimonas_sp.AAC.1
MTTPARSRGFARILTWSCGPHSERAPARDFCAIHTHTRLPPEPSSRLKPCLGTQHWRPF